MMADVLAAMQHEEAAKVAATQEATRLQQRTSKLEVRLVSHNSVSAANRRGPQNTTKS